MKSEYIEQRNGGYYVRGTRISLDSVVYGFRRGEAPDTIQADFPLLSLAQVYGAIAFYLDHEAETDAYLERQKEKWAELERQGLPLREANPALWEKLEEARRELPKHSG
jgi:uncharacterized protein (DUF433 family)